MKANYEIWYDYDDPEFGRTTLKEKVTTYEQAVKLAEDIRAHDYYSNVQVIDLTGEEY